LGLHKNIADSGCHHASQRRTIDGLKPKDLVGIPWHLAFALQADGWWLRSDIICLVADESLRKEVENNRHRIATAWDSETVTVTVFRLKTILRRDISGSEVKREK
jgi:hypothetical protein